MSARRETLLDRTSDVSGNVFAKKVRIMSLRLGKLLKKLTVVTASLVVLCGVTAAQAGFIVDPFPGGDQLNLNNGKNQTTGFGDVLGDGVNLGSNGVELFSTASGNATVKPDGSRGAQLHSITFTPFDDTVFNAFSFRGQLTDNAGGVVSVHWVASNTLFGDIVFNNLGTNALFERVGIYSIDGGTLKSVTLSAFGDGFKQLKQFELGHAPVLLPVLLPVQIPVPVPEPNSLALLGIGALGFAFAYGRRKQAV